MCIKQTNFSSASNLLFAKVSMKMNLDSSYDFTLYLIDASLMCASTKAGFNLMHSL